MEKMLGKQQALVFWYSEKNWKKTDNTSCSKGKKD